MELTAQSIVSQEGGSGLEEDSRSAEAGLVIPLQLCNLIPSQAPSYCYDSDWLLLCHHGVLALLRLRN